MKLKSSFERVSSGSFLRNKIAAVLTLFASASCATPAANVAEPAPEPLEATSFEEDPTAPVIAEFVAAVGGEGERLQPDGRSYVLCQHSPDETDPMLFLNTLAKEAVQRLCDRIGILFESVNLEKDVYSKGIYGKQPPYIGFYCVKVTLSNEFKL